MFSSGRIRLGKRTAPSQDEDPTTPISPVDPPGNPVVVDPGPGGGGGGGGGGGPGFEPNDPDGDFGQGTTPGAGDVVRQEPGDAVEDTRPGDTIINRRRRTVYEPINGQWIGAADTSAFHSPDGTTWARVQANPDLSGVARLVGTEERCYALVGRGEGARIVESTDAFASAVVATPGLPLDPLDIDGFLTQTVGTLLVSIHPGGTVCIYDRVAIQTSTLACEPVAVRCFAGYVVVLGAVAGGYKVFFTDGLYPDSSTAVWRESPLLETELEMRAVAGWLRMTPVGEETPPLNLPFYFGDDMSIDGAGWRRIFGDATPTVETVLGEPALVMRGTTTGETQIAQGFPLPQELREAANGYVHAAVDVVTATGSQGAITVDAVEQAIGPARTTGAGEPEDTNLSFSDNGEVFLPGRMLMTATALQSSLRAMLGTIPDTRFNVDLDGDFATGDLSIVAGASVLAEGTYLRNCQANGSPWPSPATLTWGQTATNRYQLYQGTTRICAVSITFLRHVPVYGNVVAGYIDIPTTLDTLFTMRSDASDTSPPSFMYVRLNFEQSVNASLKLFGFFGKMDNANGLVSLEGCPAGSAVVASVAPGAFQDAGFALSPKQSYLVVGSASQNQFVPSSVRRTPASAVASDGVAGADVDRFAMPCVLHLRGASSVHLRLNHSVRTSGSPRTWGSLRCMADPWTDLGADDDVGSYADYRTWVAGQEDSYVRGTDIRNQDADGNPYATEQVIAGINATSSRPQFFLNSARQRQITARIMAVEPTVGITETRLTFPPTASPREHIFSLGVRTTGAVVSTTPRYRAFINVRLTFGTEASPTPTSATFKLRGFFGQSIARPGGGAEVGLPHFIDIQSVAGSGATAFFERCDTGGVSLTTEGSGVTSNQVARSLGSPAYPANTVVDDPDLPVLLHVRNATSVTLRIPTRMIRSTTSTLLFTEFRVQQMPWGTWTSKDALGSQNNIPPVESHTATVTIGGETYSASVPSDQASFTATLPTTTAPATPASVSLDYSGSGQTLAQQLPSGTLARTLQRNGFSASVSVASSSGTFVGTFDPSTPGTVRLETATEQPSGLPAGVGFSMTYAAPIVFPGGFSSSIQRHIDVSHSVVQEGEFLALTSAAPGAYSTAEGDFPMTDAGYARIRLAFDEVTPSGPPTMAVKQVVVTGRFDREDDLAGYLTVGGDAMSVNTVVLDPNASVLAWANREQSAGSSDTPVVDLATVEQTEGVVGVSLNRGARTGQTWLFSDDGRTWRSADLGDGPMTFARQAGGLLFAGRDAPQAGLYVGRAPGSMVPINGLASIKSVDRGFMTVPSIASQETETYEGRLDEAPEWATKVGTLTTALNTALTHRVLDVSEDVPE